MSFLLINDDYTFDILCSNYIIIISFSDVDLSDVDKAEASEDEESDNEPEEDLDEMDAILRDPDFKNMSDSEGDDLPLFDDLSEDEKSGDDEGTYRAKEKRSKKAKVTQVGSFDLLVVL